MDSGLKENDPNNAVRKSEESGVRPGFLGGDGGGDKPQGYSGQSAENEKKNKKAKQAREELAGAEDGAAKNDESEQEGELYRGGDNVERAKNNEEKAEGLYNGDGGKNDAKKMSLKGALKKGGPFGVVLFIIATFSLGAGSFMNGSSVLVSWKENVTSQNGQNSAVMNRRGNYMMRKLLSTNRSTTSDSFFGGTKFKISTKLANKLKSQNINYVETDDVDGKPLRLLVFEDVDGKVIPIVASDSDVGRANGLVGKAIDIDGQRVTISDTSMTLRAAQDSNISFRQRYNDATLTFTGKIAGWFDNVADSLFRRIVGEKARNRTKIDEPDEEKVDDLLYKNKSDGVEDSDAKIKDGEVEDENGNRPIDAEFDDGEGGKISYADADAENGAIKTGADVDAVKGGLKAKAQKAAMLSSTLGCAFLRGMGAISTAVGAIGVTNVVNYASTYLELADKIKAGDADEVTHIAMNNLNTPVTSTVYDRDGNEVEVKGPTNASAGFNAPFSKENIINENDPSALVVNREYTNQLALRRLTGGGVFVELLASVMAIGGGVAAFRACTTMQVAAGVFDGFMDIVSIFTMGIAKGIKEIISGSIQNISLAAAMTGITVVIGIITPIVANWFASSLKGTLTGIPGGYAMQSGAQVITNSNLQMSTGRFATKENAIQVFGLTKDVEKEWAWYDRATKSPFDITSQYTFLGSLYSSALPIINSSKGGMLVSTVSSLANLTGASALALMSTSASAANEVENQAISIASDEHCNYLQSVGVAGDYACNKWSGAFVGELESLDPEENYTKMQSYGSFDGEDSDGNPTIKKDSEYANFIVACVVSDTQPGTMSGLVEGFIEGTRRDVLGDDVFVNGIANFATNLIPFEGFVDALDATEQLNNIPWNSGYNCTCNTNDAVFNERCKSYSMYNLDQRVLSAMDVIETNSTMAFLDDYYKENPLDDSFEGQIARISGMTKEEVEDTLALIEYYQFVANYNPLERYAFGAPAVEIYESLWFDNNNVVAGEAILLNTISFADVRNRSFAV